MKIHELKTIAPYFQFVNEGKKTFELRKNDRDYHYGDILHLREYNPLSENYTGNECLVKVGWILRDFPDALDDNYVIMNITKIAENY